MTAINATSARKNLYQLIQDVNTNSTPITITNSRGKNAVLLSEDDWNAIQETVYLNSIPGMVVKECTRSFIRKMKPNSDN